MNKKKKLWISVVALVLAAAGLLTWVLVPKAPTEEVKVYSFDMAGYVNYYGMGTESYGMVTTDRVQSIFVTDTQKVTEILVYQGQQVKKGDVLYRYDTTLSDLELERKDLSIQQMEMNLKNAKEELKTLKAMKPMVIPDEPEETKPKEEITKIPSGQAAGVPFSGDGKTKNTAFYIWTQGAAFEDKAIFRFFDLAEKTVGQSIYVVFCEAPRAGATITYKTGVQFTLRERDVTAGAEVDFGTANGPDANGTQVQPEENPDPLTEPDQEENNAQPSEETKEPEETDSKDETEPTNDTSGGDETESTEGTTGEEENDPTEGTSGEEETDPTESTDGEEEPSQPGTPPADTVEQYFTMKFYNPTSASTVDTTKDDIVWNSGYTYSELVSMRNEKQKEIDELTFQIKIGKAELKIMEKEADDGEVKAEFDGYISSVLEPQNALEINAPMIKVAGGGGFYVEGAISELDLATIQVGQAVTVNSWDTYMTYEGTVVEIGQYPTEDGNYYSYGASNVSYYPYKVFIDESADLQEGYYVSMTYQAEPSEEGIMYLENAFLRRENGESFVYVRGEDGLLEKRVVQTGDSSGGYMTQILSGLSQTDYIAFPYGKEVVEGAPTAEGTFEDLYGY